MHLFFSITYYSVRAPCILNKIMVTKLDYYSLTQTVELVKLKLIICIIKTFENKDDLIIVIIQFGSTDVIEIIITCFV